MYNPQYRIEIKKDPSKTVASTSASIKCTLDGDIKTSYNLKLLWNRGKRVTVYAIIIRSSRLVLIRTYIPGWKRKTSSQIPENIAMVGQLSRSLISQASLVHPLELHETDRLAMQSASTR
jgi:hypothetical protein